MNFIRFFLLIFSGISYYKAQIPNPVSFHTAVNAGLNGTIPLGATDLNWVASTVSINGPFVPAVRASNLQLAWLASPFITANWITYPHPCVPDLTEHNCLGNVNEYFRLTFDLPQLVCNEPVNSPGAYCLTMNYFADNCVKEIFVNGISSYTNPMPSYFASDFTASGGKTVTICDNWQAGTNTLVVHVRSSPPTAGLLAFITASATTPGGFSVTTTATNVTCSGGSNGTGSVSLPGYLGPASYTWLPSGGNGPSANNLAPGIYTVNVAVPLCNYTNTLLITQPGTFAINVSTPGPVCKGSKITFTASGAGQFNWFPGNLTGSLVTVGLFATTIFTVNGFDANGCVSSSTISAQVSPCTALKESSGLDIKVSYLANGLLSIQDSSGECFVEIVDMNGNILLQKDVRLPAEIDLRELKEGIFLMRISNNYSTAHRKIVRW